MSIARNQSHEDPGFTRPTALRAFLLNFMVPLIKTGSNCGTDTITETRENADDDYGSSLKTETRAGNDEDADVSWYGLLP